MLEAWPVGNLINKAGSWPSQIVRSTAPTSADRHLLQHLQDVYFTGDGARRR